MEEGPKGEHYYCGYKRIRGENTFTSPSSLLSTLPLFRGPSYQDLWGPAAAFSSASVHCYGGQRIRGGLRAPFPLFFVPLGYARKNQPETDGWSRPRREEGGARGPAAFHLRRKKRRRKEGLHAFLLAWTNAHWHGGLALAGVHGSNPFRSLTHGNVACLLCTVGAPILSCVRWRYRPQHTTVLLSPCLLL